jgi:hypothetical protein
LNKKHAMRFTLAVALVSAIALAALGGASSALSTGPYGWVESTLPDAPTIQLWGISALSPNDIYAVGFMTGSSEGRIYHFDGNSWTMRLGGLQAVYGVTALDPQHVWAYGNNGLMQFYNGSTWRAQAMPGPQPINSVSALDANHVWAVGDSGVVYFFNGTSWARQRDPGGSSLRGVYVLNQKKAWAVGINGAILSWDGNTWADQSIGGSINFNAVSALDDNCVWAVGNNGLVRFWNGTAWVNASPGTAESLWGVSALDVNHVFCAAGGGKVFFWDGLTWQMLQTPATRTLTSLSVLDTDHIYAVTDMGNLEHGYSMLEAQASTFYFAEGTCRPTFDPYICIQNPDNATDAQVTITYMLGNGTNTPQTLTVPKSSRTTVTVKNILGSGDDAAHDFSAKVECTNGVPIIAERPMYFSYRSTMGVIITGGSDVIGALQPRPTFYFAEGTCRPNFDPYLCLQNPGAANSNVLITYMLGNGATRTQSVVVPPRTRKTIAVKATLGSGNDAAHDFSAKVTTTDGTNIVAERPMYFSYISSLGIQETGGHDVVGAATPAKAFYFAEGTCRPNFDPYICIQNPGPGTANVKITYMLGNGNIVPQTVSVPTNTRTTVAVKSILGSGADEAHDFSAKVETTNGARIIAERPMYFNYTSSMGVPITGGHDVIGALYASGAFYFAEGTCRPNFDPYLCIQNPTAVNIAVDITYMKGDGTTSEQALTVPHNSRFTVNVKNQLGSGDDAAHDFSVRVESLNVDYNDVIVERPMYFNYRNSMGVFLTGGHDVVGYTP